MTKRFLEYAGFESLAELFSALTIDQINASVWDWAVNEGIPSFIAQNTFDRLMKAPYEKYIV